MKRKVIYKVNIMALLVFLPVILYMCKNSKYSDFIINDSFEQIDGQINGYDYVDLGLPSGLKWATCNVGASSPSEYGNYYAWGEVEPKSSYEGGNNVTNGKEIGDISGNSQYDAARANWGGTWRLPTIVEFAELIDNCIWIWTSEDGNYGCKVIGPTGNSIFLPAAGYRDGVSFLNAGSYGGYWSSTPDSNTRYSYRLNFYSSTYNTNCYYRYYGRSVRPVSD